jgi:hypothetical protein
LATKLEAYRGRGFGEPRSSQDMEDILTVLDGNKRAIESIRDAPESVRAFLKQSFVSMLKKRSLLEEAVAGYLRAAGEPAGRIKRVMGTIEAIAGS